VARPAARRPGPAPRGSFAEGPIRTSQRRHRIGFNGWRPRARLAALLSAVAAGWRRAGALGITARCALWLLLGVTGGGLAPVI
jgi:hypothetical protein